MLYAIAFSCHPSLAPNTPGHLCHSGSPMPSLPATLASSARTPLFIFEVACSFSPGVVGFSRTPFRPLPDQVNHPGICSGFHCCCHLQTPSAAEALLSQGWERPIFSAQACATVTTRLTLCCHPHQICRDT